MKKTKFLALALIVAMALMGAGYAYWTDQLTLTGTVETGNLEVIYTDLDIEPSSIYIKEGTEANWTDKDLNIHIVDMYPGSSAKTIIEVTNTGTVPAVLENVRLQSISIPSLSGGSIHNVFNSENCLRVKAGNYDRRIQYIHDVLTDAYAGTRINPGESATFEFDFYLPYKNSPDNRTQEEEVSFSLRMNWRQYNPATGK